MPEGIKRTRHPPTLEPARVNRPDRKFRSRFYTFATVIIVKAFKRASVETSKPRFFNRVEEANMLHTAF